jgi:hypothetical protein
VAMVVFGSSFAVPARHVFCIPPFFLLVKTNRFKFENFFWKNEKLNVKCVIIYW